MRKPASAYEEYLRLGELLALHAPRTDQPAEALFITVHQVSELWLAALVRETRAAARALARVDLAAAGRALRRIPRMLKQMLATMDLLTTMLPSEFAAFRDELGEASAGQSWQYVEFAKACRAGEGSLWKVYGEALERSGFGGIAELYYSEDLLADGFRDVAELLLDIDDSLAEWRRGHLSLVARQIGELTGTGGQSAEYLRAGVDRRLFPELIDARSEIHEFKRSYAG